MGYFKRGYVVMVYEDPLTQLKPEGQAALIQREDFHHGPARRGECERWTVEFLDEPGAQFSRLVCRKKEVSTSGETSPEEGGLPDTPR